MADCIGIDDMTMLFSQIAQEKKKLKAQAQAQALQIPKVNKNIETQADKDDKADNDATPLEINPNLDIDIRCSDCRSLNIKELNGYFTCLNCGLKNDIVIDSGQEWRFYGNDDHKGGDPSRCDMPMNELLPKSSMGGMVGYGGKETATTKRIRNMNHWYSIPYKESTLMETFNNITIMAQNSGLNQCIIEEAKYMYKKVSDLKASRRTKKEGMKAGSISLACKLKGVARNCDEIARICHIKNNKTLRKSIKTFEEIWNIIQTKERAHSNKLKNAKIASGDLEKGMYQDSDNDSSDDSSDDSGDDSGDDDIFDGHENDYACQDNIINPSNGVKGNGAGDDDSDDSGDIQKDSGKDSKKEQSADNEMLAKLHRFISKLGMDDKVFYACKTILIHVENENYLNKHNPLSRIAAVIFYINERYNLNISKHSLMQICSVSDITINKCYQKLMYYKPALNMIDIVM
jgi:transcription initiation factor TFIIIB Brf1 subunit/transcription initiation factor TFIIB